MRIRPFLESDTEALIALWQRCGLTRPWNDPRRDILRKLDVQREWFLVGETDRQLVASVMAGYDGHRGWVNYLGVDPSHQRRGLGGLLMQAVETRLQAAGCPKINLQIRHDNDAAVGFYAALGYVEDATHSFGKLLIDDQDSAPSPSAASSSRGVVLASRNTKKLREMQALLSPLGWRVRAVSEFSDEEPEESAVSFVENALIKARHAAATSGLPAIADDSGLEVAALGGAPGVRSARYAGVHGDDQANNQKLIESLAAIQGADRSARFVSLMVYLRHPDDPTPIVAEGAWRGRILEAPQGDSGFGYDPLFYVPETACSAAELAPEIKNAISHRGRAAALLLQRLHEC